MRAGELGGEEVVTVGADDSVEETLVTMKDHKNMDEDKLGDVVAAISADS